MKKNMKVVAKLKLRVKPKSNSIPHVKHNCYTTSSMLIA